jgi:hypothetical protein
MDVEIDMIYKVLSHAGTGQTTSEISKIIHDLYKKRVSRTIVKNYLWSYFRNMIDYDSANYTYKLKNDHRFFIKSENINIGDSPRLIAIRALGDKMEISISERLNLQNLVKAIAIFYLEEDSSGKKKDLIKKLNQILQTIE